MTENVTSVEAFEAHMRTIRSSGTAEKYAGAVRYFLRALDEMGIAALEQIPATILTKYVLRLCADGYQPNTVHLYCSAAKKYLKYLRDQGVKIPEPLPPDMPRVHVKLRPVIPQAYLQRYVDLSYSLLAEPYSTVVALMPFVGLRGAEMVKLQLTSLSKRTIELRGGETRDSFVLQLVGKGGDERIVPVLQEGRVILTEYLRGWRRHQRGPWLFPRPPRGKTFVSDRTVRAAVTRLCDPLGLAFSPHTLRRTYLVCLWRRGVDATVIAKIAGHRSIQTTYKHYLSLDEEDILLNVHTAQRRA